jgi:hypothetical protein
MRANAWEGIGKELKIKHTFYVSSHDVRIMCPRLKVWLNSCEQEKRWNCVLLCYVGIFGGVRTKGVDLERVDD